MLVGSPEWFKEESKSDYNIWLNEMIENRRVQFINWFSPDKLAAMDNKTLLMRVFSPSETSMMRMLMYDDDCRWFGAAGKYAYTACVYYDQSMRTWKYKQGQRPETINQAEAEEKAAYIREKLLFCIKCIQDTTYMFLDPDDNCRIAYIYYKVDFRNICSYRDSNRLLRVRNHLKFVISGIKNGSKLW